MAAIIELLGSLVFEFIAYAVGRVFVLFVPGLHVEPWFRQRASQRWNRLSFTYTHNGRRYLRTQSVQLLGLALVAIFIAIFAATVGRR